MVRSAFRGNLPPEVRNTNGGFRVVCELSPEAPANKAADVPGKKAKQPALPESLPGRVLTIPAFEGWPDRGMLVPGSQTAIFSNSLQNGVIWDLKTNRPLQRFDKHGIYVHIWGLAVSPDGKQVLSGDDKGKIFLWNASTAQLIRPFEGHAGGIWHLGFASDGKHFVSLAGDGEVRLWEVATGASQKSPELFPVPEKDHHFAFTHSPDARQLLLGQQDGSLLWFEVATGKTLHRWKAHETAVRAVAVARDGKFAVSGGFEGTIRLWDLKTQQEVAAVTGPVNCLAFTPNNRRVVSGGADKTVRVWDLAARKEVQCFRGHTGPIAQVDVSSDGRYALSMTVGTKELAIVWRLPDDPGMPSARTAD
jgi:WD40 repeat protein